MANHGTWGDRQAGTVLELVNESHAALDGCTSCECTHNAEEC